MHPELTARLAADRTRGLIAAAEAHRAAAAVPRPRSGRRLGAGYHINWSRVSLAGAEGGRPGGSWAIVITGTRTR